MQNAAPSPSPPVIFSPRRRLAAFRRAALLQQQPDAPRFIMEDMLDDVADRLAFLRHSPRRCLMITGWPVADGVTPPLPPSDPPSTPLFDHISIAGGYDDAKPLAAGDYDLIICLGTLDTVNDLPGALIHLRNGLTTQGLMIASFFGAGSLPALRAAMLAADGDRPAPRLHPMVDVRAGGQLLQRTGWTDPVIDTRTLTARYRSLNGLIGDLRAMGSTNILADSGPSLNRSALARAAASFGEGTVEQFEILTISGWNR